MGTEQKGLMDPTPVIPIHLPPLESSVSTPNPAQRLARQPAPAPLPVSAELHPFSFRLEKIGESSLDFPCFIFLALEAVWNSAISEYPFTIASFLKFQKLMPLIYSFSLYICCKIFSYFGYNVIIFVLLVFSSLLVILEG